MLRITLIAALVASICLCSSPVGAEALESSGDWWELPGAGVTVLNLGFSLINGIHLATKDPSYASGVLGVVSGGMSALLIAMVLVTEEDGTDSSGFALIVGGTGLLSAALGAANIKSSRARMINVLPTVRQAGDGRFDPGFMLTVRF